MEIENTRVFGKEITNQRARNINKRKFDEFANEMDCGPSKQMRRLNNYKGLNHGPSKYQNSLMSLPTYVEGGSGSNGSNGGAGNGGKGASSGGNGNNTRRAMSTDSIASQNMTETDLKTLKDTMKSMGGLRAYGKENAHAQGKAGGGGSGKGARSTSSGSGSSASSNSHSTSHSSISSLDLDIVNKPGKKAPAAKPDGKARHSQNGMLVEKGQAAKRQKGQGHGKLGAPARQGKTQDTERQRIRDIIIKRLKLPQWDVKEFGSESWPIDYLDEIVTHLRFSELAFDNFDCECKSDYMICQSDITPKMRLILLDWLIEVHRKFGLLQPTLFLSINLLDRFLSTSNIHRSKLQLTGCCAMWVASKYHEIYAPEIADFVYISDNAFDTSELIGFEQKLLTKLNFNLTVATPLSFAQRYVKIGVWEYQAKIYPTVHKANLIDNETKELKIAMLRSNNSNDTSRNDDSNLSENIGILNDIKNSATVNVSSDARRKSNRDAKIIENLVYYLIEHCMMDYKLSLLMPSKIACACLAYTLLGTKLQEWNEIMVKETKFTLEDLLDAIQAIDKIVKNTRCKHKAVRKKYSSNSKSRVALLQFNDFNMDLIVQQVRQGKQQKQQQVTRAQHAKQQAKQQQRQQRRQ